MKDGGPFSSEVSWH